VLPAKTARGVVATGVMSLSFLARPALYPPPRVVARNVARKAGVDIGDKPPALEHPYWAIAHLGFGVALGAIHALLPRPRSGTRFGIAAWVANYGIALPLLGLYPRVDRDDRIRAAAGLVGHVIYGAVLGTSR
jgi:hypothetical protein